MSETLTRSDSDARPDQSPTSWWPLGAVCIAVFMLLIDITVVNVALPDIQVDFNASFDALQWIIDAYALTLAAFMLTAGSLGDRFGRRRLFIAGIAVFTLSSLACGLAPGTTALSAFRAVQGIGGAIMFATSLALIAAAYEGKQRGTAFGVWGATTGASVAIGPLVGGALTSALSWNWIFFVNLPIGAAAIWLSVTKLRESRNPSAGGVDIVGLLTFSGALALLVYALIRGNDVGWSSGRIIGEFVAAAALLAVFTVTQARREDPMLDVRLFRRPAFTGAQIVAFSLSAAVFSMFLYLSLYLQGILGYSALGAGLRFLPISVSSLVVAPFAGRLTERVPIRWLVGGGLLIACVGLALMYGLSASSSWWALLPGLLVTGTGVGAVNAPLGSLAVGVVDRSRSGMASGINSTFRQVGIATGTAAFGAIFASRVGSVLHADLPLNRLPRGAADRLSAAVTAGAGKRALAGVPPEYRKQVAHAVSDAFTSGLNALFLVGAGVALVGAVLAVFLVRQRDLVSSGQNVAGR